MLSHQNVTTGSGSPSCVGLGFRATSCNSCLHAGRARAHTHTHTHTCTHTHVSEGSQGALFPLHSPSSHLMQGLRGWGRYIGGALMSVGLFMLVAGRAVEEAEAQRLLERTNQVSLSLSLSLCLSLSLSVWLWLSFTAARRVVGTICASHDTHRWVSLSLSVCVCVCARSESHGTHRS